LGARGLVEPKEVAGAVLVMPSAIAAESSPDKATADAAAGVVTP
jgi:hypothetical protein